MILHAYLLHYVCREIIILMQDVRTHERENRHNAVQNQFWHDRRDAGYEQQCSVSHLWAFTGPDTVNKDIGSNERSINRQAGRALLEVSVCINKS